MTRPAADSVKVVWAGTGTGTVTLGAVVSGYIAFPAALNGQMVSYVIAHDTAAERETGYGVYTHSGTTLTRVFVTSPVFGGSKVSFSSGTKHVGVAPLASDIIENRDTVNPGVNDDITTGYFAGRSRWLNTSTSTLFFCKVDTDGAAEWVEVGGAGGGSVDTANSPAAGEFAKFTDANTIEGRTAAETRTDLGLVVGTNVQAFDADLTTLAANFTTASAAGSARLAFHEDTDTGSMAITVAGPASVSANAIVVLPNAAGTLLRKEEIASGTITARADDINFGGGADGDVLTVQADGSLAPEAPTAAVVNVDQYEIVARVAAGTGAATGFGGAEITEDATPAAGDMLLGWTAGTTLAKFNVGNLPTGGGSTLPIADTTGLVKGSVDATKIWRVEADGFTASTTRVLTPPNRDWAPTTFGSELTEIIDAAAGRTKLGLQALATLSTVSNSLIDAGAVTANQMYTGSATSAAAVAGIVNVDFATLGTSVGLIIITDITTVNVDLTTPAARRNVDVYNNTASGVDFAVRDASDVVITSSVPYRHVARLGWSGTVWVLKSTPAAVGHSITSHTDVGNLAVLDQVDAPTHFSASGTADVTTCLRGNNTWGAINPTQVSGGEITAGTETAIRSWSPANAKSFVDTHAAGAVGVYLPVDGTAAGGNITSITTARAGQTITIDQNIQLENDVLAARWWVLRNVHATNNITITAEATGLINGASTYVLPANGGEILLRCVTNAGTAPQCVAEGDSLTLNLGGRQLVDAELIDYSETSPADTSFGGGDNLDFALGPVQAVTLTSNVTAPLGIDNVPATGKAGSITVIINHGTGPFTWAHPANTDWGAATPPTMSSGASDVDILTYITRDGGTNWFGFVGGLDFA